MAARRTAISQPLGQGRALLDTQHETNLIARLRQVEYGHAQPSLQARNDASAEERYGIVEPRIAFGEDLQRRERLTALDCRLGAAGPASRSRRQRAAGLHDLHDGLVFARPANALAALLPSQLFPLLTNRPQRRRLRCRCPRGLEASRAWTRLRRHA